MYHKKDETEAFVYLREQRGSEACLTRRTVSKWQPASPKKSTYSISLM